MRKNSHSDYIDFELTIAGTLIGRRIVRTIQWDEQHGELHLDDGTVLEVRGNQGCGGCGNGWYDLKKLEECDNVITNVKCQNINDEIYSIFVFTQDEQIEVVQYEGYDNGYYGTGYWVSITYDLHE